MLPSRSAGADDAYLAGAGPPRSPPPANNATRTATPASEGNTPAHPYRAGRPVSPEVSVTKRAVSATADPTIHSAGDEALTQRLPVRTATNVVIHPRIPATPTPTRIAAHRSAAWSICAAV